MPEFIPVDHDPFAEPDPKRSEPLRITVTPRRQPKLVPVDHDPFAEPEQPEQGFLDTATDLAKSAGVGLARGAISVAGWPGDVGQGLANLSDWVGLQTGLLSPEHVSKRLPHDLPFGPFGAPPSSADIQRGIERLTGEFYEPKTTAGEYTRTLAEFVPAIAGGGGSLARRALMQTAVPATAAETAGQVTKGTSAEPYARVAAAVLAPAAAARSLRAITPFPASPERMSYVEGLRRAGVDLTAGQTTGNRALRYAEAHLSEIPGGGGGAARAAERQKEQFTAAALRHVGENATRATPEVIDRAFTRIGRQFDRLAARNTLRADQQFATDIRDAAFEYFDGVNPSARAPVVENTVTDIVRAMQNNRGRLSGQTYQALRSRLDRRARTARADPQLSEALHGLRNALDDAMERSMIAAGRSGDVKAWREARRQYRNLLPIERAMTGAGEDTALGLLSPAQLRSAVAAQGRRAYARGRGDLAELARAGTATMLPMPNSGTPGRVATQALPAALGAGVGALGGGPVGASAGAVAAAALPPIMGRALMSRPVQAYLANQTVPEILASGDLLGGLLRAQAAAPPPDSGDYMGGLLRLLGRY